MCPCCGLENQGESHTQSSALLVSHGLPKWLWRSHFAPHSFHLFPSSRCFHHPMLSLMTGKISKAILSAFMYKYFLRPDSEIKVICYCYSFFISKPRLSDIRKIKFTQHKRGTHNFDQFFYNLLLLKLLWIKNGLLKSCFPFNSTWKRAKSIHLTYYSRLQLHNWVFTICSIHLFQCKYFPLCKTLETDFVYSWCL